MSTQLTVFTDAQIDVIYKATHLTETLNKKLATALPAGIYQGFNLVVHGTTDLVGVDPDPNAPGHVAVIENDTDRSITVRNSGGAFTLDLSDLRDGGVTKRYAIAIWGQYSKGSNTSAAIRAYETYPTNELLSAPEASTLAILGEVEVAAGGAPALIPAASITQARRTSAWQNLAPGHGFWKPLLQNGNFEAASTGTNEMWPVYGWRLGDGGSLLGATGIESRSGTQSLNWLAVGLTSLGFTAEQYLGESVTEGTDRIRVRGFYKILQIPTAGEIEVVLDFADSTGNPGSLDVRYSIPIDHVSADWEEFGAIVDVPVGATQLTMFALECDDTLMDVPVATHIARFDDWQVWKSWDGVESQQAGRLGGRVDASLRDLMFPSDLYTDRETAPRLNRSSSTLLAQKTIDVAQGNFRARNSLGVGDDLVQSLAEATIARLVLPHKGTNQSADGDTFTLLLESLPHTGTEGSARYYADDLGNLVFTHNAKYTALNTWTRDESDFEAIKVQVHPKTGLEVSYREADNTATFTAWRVYLDFQRTHALLDTDYVDFSTLWEVEEPQLGQTSPYTVTLAAGLSGSGAAGWVNTGAAAGEDPSWYRTGIGSLVYISDSPRQGWYRVLAFGGDITGVQVQLGDIDTGTPVNFGTTGSLTMRIYAGAFLGHPVGVEAAKGLTIDTDEQDENDAIKVRYNTSSGQLSRFSVSSIGYVTARRFALPIGDKYIEVLPLTSWVPGADDWNINNIGAGELYWSSVSTGDEILCQPLLRNTDIVNLCSVYVDPTGSAMTLEVFEYDGTQIGSDTSSGASPQLLTVVWSDYVIGFNSPPRIVLTSGQGGDRLHRAYIQYHRPNI